LIPVDAENLAAYVLGRMPIVAPAAESALFQQILPRVSRSFYLSLRILPRRVRPAIGLAYLFCRAADTIADTAVLPRNLRHTYLERYRTAFVENDATAVRKIQHDLHDLTDHQQNPSERELLTRLPECFTVLAAQAPDDQLRIRDLVLTLTQGMQMDLAVFPAEAEGKIVALETREELDRYTYFVAGCVGEFWTKVAVAHLPALQQWDIAAMAAKGVRFGKGLQLTNILRDIAQDLRIGRCYLPRVDLAVLGVQPEEVLTPSTLERVQPLIGELLELTLSHYREGWAYTLAIPRREWRLRLACAWPLLIGVATLTAIRHSPQLLDPNIRVKIARAKVYRILLRSLMTVWSDRALDCYYGQLRKGGDVVG
jgi:farnesyl-diphosphate farnesyltransferase